MAEGNGEGPRAPEAAAVAPDSANANGAGKAPEPPRQAAQAAGTPAASAPASAGARMASAPAAACAAAPKRHGWIVAIVAIVCACALVAFGISSCSSAIGRIVPGHSSGQTPAARESGATIAVITIDGTIGYDGSASSPEGLKSLLDQAAGRSDVKAVVLRVNSGGGTATAGEEMAEYVKRFRADSGKPVVVSSASLNASAAYEVSSQADLIYVGRTTEIGAIGTVMQTYDLSELMDKLGISVDNIASADSKDSTYGTRPLTDEERAYYQAMVDELNDTFVQNVADGRGLSLDEARELATGLPFAGSTAVTNGVADKIGTREDAVAAAAELAGAGDDYHEEAFEIDSSVDLSSLASILGKSGGTGQGSSSGSAAAEAPGVGSAIAQ